MKMDKGFYTHQEILSQPAAWAAALDSIEANTARLFWNWHRLTGSTRSFSPAAVPPITWPWLRPP